MQINIVIETITVLITLYLTLSLTIKMPCIAHNTQHYCLWIFTRHLIQCHTKSYCTSYTITTFMDWHMLLSKITLPLEANL